MELWDETSVASVNKLYIRACILSHFIHVWLCDSVDHSPPGSSVNGILQARLLEWVVIPPSRRSSWPRNQIPITSISCIGKQVLYHCCHLGSQIVNTSYDIVWGFLGSLVVKNLSANGRDSGSIPGWGRSPGEGNGNPLQYSCLENPTDCSPPGFSVHRSLAGYSPWGHKESDTT